MEYPRVRTEALAALRLGLAIPAHPLALTDDRRLDEPRQRALTRYYLAAGAGGVAVGVHTTQFAIREPAFNLLRPVLELAAEQCARAAPADRPIIKVAGVCGPTTQAVAEAELARQLGYDLVLLSLAALKNLDNVRLIQHCRSVAAVMPLFGFYLQPSVGGRVLDFDFWTRFCEIPSVTAIKIAPFNRYHTLDVVRAVAASGRALDADTPTPPPDAIALYTGNDDHIVEDLLGIWSFPVAGRPVRQRIVGGLLGHWAVWTRAAVDVLSRCRQAGASSAVPCDLLQLARHVTDMNAALFDAANSFRGCVAGIHEVLRRQGLLANTHCLDPHETLSPGQADLLTRVCRDYAYLTDDEFVAANLPRWLA